MIFDNKKLFNIVTELEYCIFNFCPCLTWFCSNILFGIPFKSLRYPTVFLTVTHRKHTRSEFLNITINIYQYKQNTMHTKWKCTNYKKKQIYTVVTTTYASLVNLDVFSINYFGKECLEYFFFYNCSISLYFLTCIQYMLKYDLDSFIYFFCACYFFTLNYFQNINRR